MICINIVHFFNQSGRSIGHSFLGGCRSHYSRSPITHSAIEPNSNKRSVPETKPQTTTAPLVSLSHLYNHQTLRAARLQERKYGEAAGDDELFFRRPEFQGSPDGSQKWWPHRRSQNPLFCVKQFFPNNFNWRGVDWILCCYNEAGGDPRFGARHADQGRLSRRRPPSHPHLPTPPKKPKLDLVSLSLMLVMLSLVPRGGESAPVC